MITRRGFLKAVGCCSMGMVLPVLGGTEPDKNTKYNVVFILADDLGWADLGCYGSTFHETPHIDRLAGQGVRFCNAYASHPVCGPSRQAIMCGKTPARMGNTGVLGNMKPEEVTWPEVLQGQGYVNYFSGKWHLGQKESILTQGFDVDVAGHRYGQPGSYYYPYENANHPRYNVPDLTDDDDGDYLTDSLTDRAVDFIKDNKDKPFLVYLSHYAVHTPIEGKESHVKHFQGKLAKPVTGKDGLRAEGHPANPSMTCVVQQNPDYAAMIKSLDDSVGRIMQALEEMKIAGKTIFVFTSDQGGLSTFKGSNNLRMITSNEPLRAGKGWMYEGGIRVPLIVKWPGRTRSGTANDSVTINTDIYPTILDMLSMASLAKQHLDGISIKKAILGGDIPFSRTLYWAYPLAHASGHVPSVALRKGRYKLIFWLKTKICEVYDIESDVSEKNDLSQSRPDIKEALMSELHLIPQLQDIIKRTK